MANKRSRRRARIIVPKPDIVAPPGNIAPPQDSVTPKMSVITYGPDRIEERNIESVAALKELRAQGVLWLDIEGVGDAKTFNELGDLFGLHSLALEDVVNLHQRPKAEDYDDHAFVVLQMPTSNDTASMEQISLFFGADYVITVQEGLLGDCLDPVRLRLRAAKGKIRQRGADYLAYAIMDAIIDRFFPLVEQLNLKIEQLEDQVVSRDSHVGEIHATRHDLHEIRRVLASTREAIGLLMRGEMDVVSETTLEFLRDCHDHTAQLLDVVEALRELINGLMDLHLAETSNRMNEVMQVLTIIATIFIPLGFLAGLYGMNFDRTSSPWNMPELGWAFGYPFALLLMLATSVGFLLYFHHRGWLGKRPPKR